MKSTVALFLSTASLLHAGSPDLETSITPATQEPWIKPTIDIRARYEFRDMQGGLDPSQAFTTRERLRLKSQAWNGFSFFVEGEFTQAIVDDYSGGALGAEPFDPTLTPIADPETNELNQGYIQYSGFDTVVKTGRQRIIYDNAAFIGNIGWRQNEQTFDAISLSNTSIDGLTLNYAYIGQVNRIFGSDATLQSVGYVDSETNLFNASYTGIQGGKLGAYAYLMNFPDNPAWDNNTFGISAKGTLAGLTLYGEGAYQDMASNADQEAYYYHSTVTKGFGGQSVTVGLESLGAGFKTPLATVHAFNGYADAFIGGRITGAHNGLTDVYVSHTLPIFWGMKWTNALHALGDNDMSDGYGWEFDSVLVKKFDDNFSALAKLALFDGKDQPFAAGGTTGLKDITQFTVELDYTF
jgi:hypothetical protein